MPTTFFDFLANHSTRRARTIGCVHIWLIPLLCMMLYVTTALAQGQPEAPFGIHVVDDATGRGVPLVTLKTTNRISYVTDSNGWVAFDEPGLLGQTVYFGVSSPGYEYPADGFGFRGIALPTKPGGKATLKIHRVQIAQRIYRLTGQGIYADTIRLGKKAPIDQPLLNAQVMGQDSTSTAVYKGKLYWFWGDTGRPGYPLGNFHGTGATSLLPGKGGFDPSIGPNLNYFTTASGFVQPMYDAKQPYLFWGDCPMVLKTPEDEEMVIHYTRLKDMEHVFERGLAVWNDQKHQFEPRVQFPLDRQMPRGTNALHHADNGTDYYYFSSPYPLTRVKADWNDASHPDDYEAYTPLVPGTQFDGAKTRIERDATGKIVYAWKRGTDFVDDKRQAELIKDGLIKPDEAWLNLRDVKTNEQIHFEDGTVNWNPYRKKWIMIATRIYSMEAIKKGNVTSALGDVYYSEANAPEGPWRKAVAVAFHPHYSYYHPLQHGNFDQDGGRIIYFEGTYTSAFSDNKCPTPRYDYNQLMYKLDLSDPRLRLDVK